MKRFSLLLLCFVLPVCSLFSQKNSIGLVVDNNNVHVDGFLGINAVYHGFAYMPEQEDKGMNDNFRNLEFSRVRNIGLNVARTWYRPDFCCGDNIYNDFDWTLPKMEAFCKWLQKMKELKVDVALQAGWWFTYDTHLGNPSVDLSNDPSRFAEWIAASLDYLIYVKGFDNIKYLHMFTEPMNWDGDGSKPGNLSQNEYYKIVCKAVNDKLKDCGLRDCIKIIGPNFGSTDKADWVQWSIDNLSDVFDIYSWHTYNGIRDSNPPAEYDGWYQTTGIGAEMVEKTGKPFWIDEYGSTFEALRESPDYGNYLAQAICAFCDAGAQTSLLWILFDQQYVSPRDKTNSGDSFVNGIHRWGLAKWPGDDIENPTYPRPAWYAFGMIAKYLNSKDKSVLYTTVPNKKNKVYIVCSESCGNLSVLVVNANHEEAAFDVKFTSGLGGRTFYRHLYDPSCIRMTEEAVIPGTDKVIDRVSYSFSDTLPARGVAIYTTRKD